MKDGLCETKYSSTPYRITIEVELDANLNVDVCTTGSINDAVLTIEASCLRDLCDHACIIVVSADCIIRCAMGAHGPLPGSLINCIIGTRLQI
jgi:hypothetical protein